MSNSTNLGSNWTERSGNLQIYSNTLRNVGTSPDDSLATWNGGSYSNVFASAKVQFTSLAGSLTVGARLGSYSGGLPTAGYAAELLSSGQVKLWRLSDWAQLGTYTISGFQANQQVTLGIRANGTTISVEVDGVTRISVTDSSFSNGEVGLWSYDPSSANQHVFDDFVVTNLGQGYQPGGKVVAAQKALAQPRVKAVLLHRSAPRQAMGKTLFNLTRQTGQVWRSYYYAGAARVAMREVSDQGSEVYYILTDHLGSTSITVNEAGQRTAQVWYKPWGEVREVWGVLPTDYTYTGQRDPGWGLYYYRARWYDSYLNQWNQPDSIIPDPYNPLDWNRYAYARYNAVNNTDPTGHCTEGNDDFDECMDWVKRIERRWKNVNVVICIGSDSVANCKGWTADEVRLLYGALAHNPNDVSGLKLTFTRQAEYIDPKTNLPLTDSSVAADTVCLSGSSSCSLTLYDFAWNGGPSANFMDSQILYYTKSEGAFLGALIHELTHAANFQDPSILDEWISDHPDGDNRVGLYYPWGYLEWVYYNDPAGLEKAKQEEMMAMSTAVDVTEWLDRNIFAPYQPPWYK